MIGETNIVSNKRRKFRISYIFIFLLLIIIAAFISFKHNTKKELDKKIEAIRTAGYPVTLEELDEWYSVPDGYENGADIILNASEYYLLDQNDSKIFPLIDSGKNEFRSKPLSEEIISLSTPYLAKNKKSLDLLYTLKNYKYSRYPINLNDGFHTMLPHISIINSSIRLLQINAIYNSECSNPESVIDSIEAMIYVFRTLTLEPLCTSQLSRSGIIGRINKVLEITLNKIKFNEEELSQLQNLLNEIDEFSGIARGIIGERCIVLDALKNILTFDWDFMEVDLPPSFVLEAYKALGIIDRDALVYLDLQEEYWDVLTLSLHERLEASNVLEFELKEIKNASPLLKCFLYEPSRFVGIELRNIAGLINARTAIAVERYRLKNNELPDSLSKLVPDFLESVPLDTFDGKEIRYKKLQAGYVVYSVGEDLIDDGGKEVSEDNRNSTYDITFIVEH